MTDPSAPGSTASLRTANQQRVVDMVRAHANLGDQSATLTQAQLARLTGLAPATVSSIVRELSAVELLETIPGSGRRGTVVRLARAAGLVVGVDFGHSHLSVAVADAAATVIARDRRRLDLGAPYDAGLALADELLGTMLKDLGADRSSVRRLGLGLPAPITGGVVRSSAILPGWVGVNAEEAAGAAFGCPVVAGNDANLGALAEHQRGAARGVHTLVFLKISSGVGAGLVINDQLFYGGAGTAGEIGHLTLNENGPLCRCGSRGCLEAYCAVPTITQMLAAQLPDVTFDAVLDAAQDGNVAALRALEDAGLSLGWGLASIVNLINPELIVLGGDLARAGELILEPARIGLRRHALDAAATTPIVVGELGEQASLIGATLLAADDLDLLAQEDHLVASS